MKTYKQSTCETCLASSLLLLLNVEPSQKRELEILNHALKFSKRDFTIGHLDFVARKYNKRIITYVEDRKLVSTLKKLKFSKRIQIISKPVTLPLIKKLLYKPLIVYLDDFIFRKKFHYPHFVVIWSIDKNKFVITDPWDGKIKRVSFGFIEKGIDYLKNLLYFSPRLIQIE